MDAMDAWWDAAVLLPERRLSALWGNAVSTLRRVLLVKPLNRGPAHPPREPGDLTAVGEVHGDALPM
ncbi:hypothetical protein ColTof4_13522 [Colletotrichum tofieldiae]|nr:hypothetical protein ColTof3_00405 [Colletotrichum tofieldiae]GKT81099.1 hypothetical protein ColTof4_13522 [Colletotrichum tofieldiae]GKT88658.1 hypothetical protein Ct61P_06508 [Colletotrichum tofieldiae]